MQRLQLDLFGRVQRLSSEWHANSFAGATVHRISRARWALDMLSNIIVLRLLQPALLLLVMGAIMIWRLPVAGIAFCAVSFLYVAVSWQLSARWVRPLSVVSAARDSRLTGALADSITNNATVKTFGAEHREDKLLRAFSDEWAKVAQPAFNRATDTNAVQQIIWTVAQMAVLGLITWNAMRGKADVADVAFALAAVTMLSGQLRNLASDIRTIQRAFAEMEDAAEFLVATQETVHEPAARQSTLQPDSVDGEIAFSQVGFRYPSGAAIFENLTFTIAAGEQVALVGPSGSGKSTVVKLIQRLYDIEHGRILIDGRDIRELSPAELRGLISLVPQEPVLFHRSLAENIAYGRPSASMEEIVEAARLARAHEFIARLENGYRTFVGERGAKLSGGERQRVAIARAILADRPILLLDEATSSLDTSTEKLVQEAIAELSKGRTTIVIAHRLSTVRNADRILVFNQGQLVEQGTHAELLDISDGQYRRLVDLSLDTSELIDTNPPKVFALDPNLS
ncbi:MAG: ABC transporter ATP-binding protein/permease, partial [Alphaproteobacteria bacterium]|nr:ABC transporter ATP-binding protein/permease [Alphaproteobacteria bacterium]